MNKRIIVVTGPSGVGKTYLAEQLTSQYPGLFETAKLYTTRSPRPGEVGSDRIFISEESYEKMNQDGFFAITGTFHDKHYAYSKDSFAKGQRHTILNTWPAMLPEFAKIERCLLVAMMPSNELLPILIERIESRGENKQITSQRKELILRDITELHENHKIADRHGRLFSIKNDETVAEEIIPWLLQQTQS